MPCHHHATTPICSQQCVQNLFFLINQPIRLKNHPTKIYIYTTKKSLGNILYNNNVGDHVHVVTSSMLYSNISL